MISLSESVALQRRLGAARTASELFTCACNELVTRQGYERAVILTVRDGLLTSDSLDVLPDNASDEWRRSVLAAPIAISPECQESEIVRRPLRAVAGSHATPSVTVAALSARECALAPIVPDKHAVALVVAERATDPITEAELDALLWFGHLVALTLTVVVLRTRMREMMVEWRYLSTSTAALMREAIDATISIPVREGDGHVFPASAPAGSAYAAPIGLFTAREAEIMQLMAAGCSNREIADRLILSTNTVKTYVARLLRKLGAANRADAVARYLRLSNEN